MFPFVVFPYLNVLTTCVQLLPNVKFGHFVEKLTKFIDFHNCHNREMLTSCCAKKYKWNIHHASYSILVNELQNERIYNSFKWCLTWKRHASDDDVCMWAACNFHFFLFNLNPFYFNCTIRVVIASIYLLT